MANELGAGAYRVRRGKTLTYRGRTYNAGEAVQMSDAGAGAHHDRVLGAALERGSYPSVSPMPVALDEARAELKRTQAELERVQAELERVQAERDKAHTELELERATKPKTKPPIKGADKNPPKGDAGSDKKPAQSKKGGE
jgi:hypothetical protein